MTSLSTPPSEPSTDPAIAAKAKPVSRTRDHLANERTYLAWMRTAIALIGFGVLIARLRYLVSPQVPGTGQGWLLGLGLACIGLITVLLSTWHYFAVLTAIESNTYEPNSRWVILFSLVVTLLGAGVLYVLFSAPATVKGWAVL
ncbi:MAG: YidH family protein [Nodosilinea sp.]